MGKKKLTIGEFAAKGALGFMDGIAGGNNVTETETDNFFTGRDFQEIGNAIDSVERKIKRKRFRVELILYVMSLVIFLHVLFSIRPIAPIYEMEFAIRDVMVDEEFEPSLSHVKKNFENVKKVSEMWDWLYGPFVAAITGDFLNPAMNWTQEESRIYPGNQIVGGIRFRQLRVLPNTCEGVDPRWANVSSGCYGFFVNDENIESKLDFGENGQTYSYLPESILRGANEYGRISGHYDGGGFVKDLRMGDDPVLFLDSLREGRFIDEQTRIMYVNLNVYNPNVNLVVVASYIFEFMPTGAIIPWSQIRTMKYDSYVTEEDTFRFYFEAIFVGFLVIFTVRELGEMWEEKWAYFKDGWNWMDILNLFAFWVAVKRFGMRHYEIRYSSDPIQWDSLDYINLELSAKNWINVFSLISLNLLLSFLKVFKYLQGNRRMSILWMTLNRASGDLASFLVFFSIVFLGFATMGHLLFGTEIVGYRFFTHAFSTLFRMLLGDFDYDQLRYSNRVLAPFYFVSFIFICFFTLANMFLAIINDAYSYVTEDRPPVKLSEKPLEKLKRRLQEKKKAKERKAKEKTEKKDRKLKIKELKKSRGLKATENILKEQIILLRSKLKESQDANDVSIVVNAASKLQNDEYGRDITILFAKHFDKTDAIDRHNKEVQEDLAKTYERSVKTLAHRERLDSKIIQRPAITPRGFESNGSTPPSSNKSTPLNIEKRLDDITTKLEKVEKS